MTQTAHSYTYCKDEKSRFLVDKRSVRRLQSQAGAAASVRRWQRSALRRCGGRSAGPAIAQPGGSFATAVGLALGYAFGLP